MVIKDYLPLLSLFLLITHVSSLSKLEDQSFGAPFDDYNSGGARIIASYREGGHAKVNEQFIRLTPDRQSKRGHLWSSRRIDVHDWSVVLEFRVSGQGKTLFGDGLAFWFTDMPNIKPGDVFGVTDDFKGFSVIFDTFRNQEFLSVHKDVSVLTGDGKKGAGDRRNTERPGCDSDFRYYEGADNFDVAKSLSYVKISLKGRKLKVSIDPLATGKFKACFETANVLPHDFDISKGFFGLTATTGGKYIKSDAGANVAVIIVKVIFISAFLFDCLLLNHSFQTNPNKITNCFKLFLLYLQLGTTLLLLSRYFDF